MRIGIYDPYLRGLEGGEKYMLTIASCLSKSHNVSVFWDEKLILDRASEKFAIDLKKVGLDKNFFSADFNTFQRIKELRKYDRIIFLSDGSIPFIFSKKLILHFQFPVEWISPSLKTKFKLSRVKKIICNSYFTKFYIDNKFNVNSVVLYPPVEIKYDNKIKKENIILHMGRFGRTIEGANYKKQDVMIKTFCQMIDDGLKDWRFVLVVGVKEEDEVRFQSLKKMATGYPIEFIKNPTNSKLWENYSKAKIYWHASGFGEDLKKHPEYAEHFGISTVEAMGAGCVPIVINEGGQKEIVEDNKSGFLWNSLEQLKKQTSELIKDGDLWERLSKGSKKRAEIFSGNRFCREINEIIDEK
ncbi:MAG: glycosyltransferase [Candidatus Levyibacteriota bacterium]